MSWVRRMAVRRMTILRLKGRRRHDDSWWINVWTRSVCCGAQRDVSEREILLLAFGFKIPGGNKHVAGGR